MENLVKKGKSVVEKRYHYAIGLRLLLYEQR